jgi:small subunit ribosomal protein S20
MPHSISAKKRVRQDEKRRVRNRTIRSRIRTARHAFDKAVAEANLEAARQQFRVCKQLLHRAAGRGPLHRNTAGRTIGRLQRRLAALEKAAG